MSYQGRSVGFDLSARLDQPRSVMTETATGFTIKTNFRSLYTGWQALAPAIGSAFPTSPYTDATLRTREVKQLDPSFLCDVDLTYVYEDQNYAGGAGPLPTQQYSENASTITVPIEQNPYYKDVTDIDRSKIAEFFASPKSTLLVFTDTLAQSLFDKKLKGENHYLVPSVTEQIVTFSWGQPTSVSTEIGTLDASKKWLTISGSIQKSGLYWSRTIVNQFSAAGWDQDAGFYS